MKTEDRPVMTFRIEPALRDGLQRLFERDGISQSESIRRALRMWLESKGIDVEEGAPKTKRGRK
jgi:Arc/MetJ-type ribon-helix-helix transcriptional regulator